MSIEHQLREAAGRCLALLQRYYQSERSAKSKAVMVAEVEVIIGWLMELDLPSGVVEAGILKPVEEHLLSQYGHEAGRRINGEFVEAFEGAGMPLIFKSTYSYINYN